MAKGGFVINWDGEQTHCYKVEMDFDAQMIRFNDGERTPVSDWSKVTVHAVTSKDIEEATK